MLSSIDTFFEQKTANQITILSLILVILLGAIDYLTGFEISFSIFYMIPIAIGAWYAGNRTGYALCLCSAFSWLVVDMSTNHMYSHPVIPFWNAGVRLSFFSVIAYLLINLNSSMEREKAFASLDGLTGIMNARVFKETLKTIFSLATRYNHPTTLAYIDLDNFKKVNDLHGHNTGDELLKAVAKTLEKTVRETDFVCRLGGDEFAVLLPENDAKGASRTFENMRKQLLKLTENPQWPVGFSIGVAVFHSPPPKPDDAITCADQLMYRVKQGGKNALIIEEIASAKSDKT